MHEDAADGRFYSSEEIETSRPGRSMIFNAHKDLNDVGSSSSTQQLCSLTESHTRITLPGTNEREQHVRLHTFLTASIPHHTVTKEENMIGAVQHSVFGPQWANIC